MDQLFSAEISEKALTKLKWDGLLAAEPPASPLRVYARKIDPRLGRKPPNPATTVNVYGVATLLLARYQVMASLKASVAGLAR